MPSSFSLIRFCPQSLLSESQSLLCSLKSEQRWLSEEDETKITAMTTFTLKHRIISATTWLLRLWLCNGRSRRNIPLVHVQCCPEAHKWADLKQPQRSFFTMWFMLLAFFLRWGQAGFTLAQKALVLISQVSLLSLRGECVKRQSEFTHVALLWRSQQDPRGTCLKPIWLSRNQLFSSRCILSVCHSSIAPCFPA